MKVTIWGLAAGVRSTEGAARGAFTWRDYPSENDAKEAEKDWLKVIIRECDKP